MAPRRRPSSRSEKLSWSHRAPRTSATRAAGDPRGSPGSPQTTVNTSAADRHESHASTPPSGLSAGRARTFVGGGSSPNGWCHGSHRSPRRSAPAPPLGRCAASLAPSKIWGAPGGNAWLMAFSRYSCPAGTPSLNQAAGTDGGPTPDARSAGSPAGTPPPPAAPGSAAGAGA